MVIEFWHCLVTLIVAMFVVMPNVLFLRTGAVNLIVILVLNIFLVSKLKECVKRHIMVLVSISLNKMLSQEKITTID